MISEGVFEDAFVLHDPTSHYLHIIDMIQSAREKGEEKSGKKIVGPPKSRQQDADTSSSSDDELDEETVRKYHRIEFEDSIYFK